MTAPLIHPALARREQWTALCREEAAALEEVNAASRAHLRAVTEKFSRWLLADATKALQQAHARLDDVRAKIAQYGREHE
jgi:hypothetical protein